MFCVSLLSNRWVTYLRIPLCAFQEAIARIFGLSVDLLFVGGFHLASQPSCSMEASTVQGIDLTGIRPSPVMFPETRDKNRNEVRPGDYYPQKEKLFRGGQTPFMKLNLKPYYQSSDGNQTLDWLSAGNQTLD
jgi:hypothetical protein